MQEYYLEIRNIHIVTVILSGLLFTMRSAGLIWSAKWPRYLWIKYISYTIDSVLLVAALMLMTIIKQFPIAHSWLTVKVTFLICYIFLGILAFKKNQTTTKRMAYCALALGVYFFIISIARAHHPLGIFLLPLG